MNGRPLRAWHVEFDLLIGSGSGGEGFSFNYAPDATLRPTRPPSPRRLRQNSGSVTLTLVPAFAYLTNVTYGIDGNSNPALVTPVVSSSGSAGLTLSSSTTGTSVLSFTGSNATLNAAVPFTVSLVQPQVVSIVMGSRVIIQISGPPSAHYYLQASDTLLPAVWNTIAAASLDATGSATAFDTRSAFKTQFYRAQFVQ